jgi:hypothetical protein
MTDEAHVVVTSPTGSALLQVPWSTTVGGLFEKACDQLGLSDGNSYELWCADGVTMMNKLERTLQDLRDRRICPKREFAIRTSGGNRTQ